MIRNTFAFIKMLFIHTEEVKGVKNNKNKAYSKCPSLFPYDSEQTSVLLKDIQ